MNRLPSGTRRLARNAHMKVYMRAYRKTLKGKAVRAAYVKSAKGQAALRRYWQGSTGKAARKRYRKSSKGMANARKYARKYAERRPKRVRNPTMGLPDYLTYAQAATDIGVCKQTVQDWSAAGAFAVVRINQKVVRIAAPEWKNFKAERTANPPRRGRPRKPL